VEPPVDTAEGDIRELLSLRLAAGLRWRETCRKPARVFVLILEG
jgi:hypothetical protein